MESSTDPTNVALPASDEDLTPLQADVLEEYERLAGNMKKVHNFLIPISHPPSLRRLFILRTNESNTTRQKQLAQILDAMAGRPTGEILDGLRQLERKTSLVFTLLKASVYSIVLQHEIDNGGGDADAAGQDGGQGQDFTMGYSGSGALAGEEG